MAHHTEPNAATKNADQAGDHSADRPATDAESTAAEERYKEGDAERRADVAKHEEEMMEIGVETKGEGAFD